jgi:hypothetical protein
MKISGAAYRDIKFNIAVRCTFKTRKFIISTNIAVRCTFKTRIYTYRGALHLLEESRVLPFKQITDSGHTTTHTNTSK